MTNTQHRLSFYRFAMSLSMALIIYTLGYHATHAMSMQERVCQKGFIGYSYNVKLEKRCRPLWNQWTQEILHTNTK